MLRRYTDLPSLLCMLTRKKITLLSPNSWDDKNDAYYLELYTKKKKLGNTLALCLTQKNETYHHWSVFTSRENGVCIVFDRAELERSLDKQSALIHGSVQYMQLDKIRNNSPTIEELPFLKRYAFTDESEYRLIYPSQRKISTKDIPLPIDAIRKISINPWAHESFYEAIKTTIKTLDGCEKIKVGQSSLINNIEWCRIGDKIAKQKLETGQHYMPPFK
jgi:hypothetical protein